ncbi:hypothetical protein TNCT_23942 [Trichonephila clavata]|uniref:Uncharacterized protein n=1 Tax=Trichonephila clavata TaxID=2740835 RepID=A0A8X6K394_TRICU|nr:hypothetical protein TNCT_23942 [Trichonephila clavata]
MSLSLLSTHPFQRFDELIILVIKITNDLVSFDERAKPCSKSEPLRTAEAKYDSRVGVKETRHQPGFEPATPEIATSDFSLKAVCEAGRNKNDGNSADANVGCSRTSVDLTLRTSIGGSQLDSRSVGSSSGDSRESSRNISSMHGQH